MSRARIASAALAAALAAAGALAACSAPRSQRCRDICTREARCAEEQDEGAKGQTFDEGECVAACTALERDTEGRARVDEHDTCVKKAGLDCPALLNCK
jgi:hypothetical protein